MSKQEVTITDEDIVKEWENTELRYGAKFLPSAEIIRYHKNNTYTRITYKKYKQAKQRIDIKLDKILLGVTPCLSK